MRGAFVVNTEGGVFTLDFAISANILKYAIG
jgi:hypothetical protein